MTDDDDPGPAGQVLRFRDLHLTDVLLYWGSQGAEWFSVVALQDSVALVQDCQGVTRCMPAHVFARRYALAETGRFALKWRISPIEAVRLHKEQK